jgi:hypothetical protein
VGETQKQPFELSFNSRLRVDFQGARVTSDGGPLLVRELDEHLGFGELIATVSAYCHHEPRTTVGGRHRHRKIFRFDPTLTTPRHS